jgi:hypothetical protein
LHISSLFVNKHGLPQAILFSDWSFFLNSPPLKPLGQINRNLVGTIYGKSCKKVVISCWSVDKHGCYRQFLLLIGRYKTSSPLKPLGQIKRNLVGSIYGTSSIKFVLISRFVNKHGRHRQFLFLIGQFIKKISETAWSNELKLGTNHLW